MTFEEWTKKQFDERGLRGKDAATVLEVCKNDTDLLGAMQGRWNDDTEGYPDYYLVTIWLSICEVVINWIDTNKPKAFYRSLFT